MEDLERLGWAGGLSGREDVYLGVLERAYQVRLDRGETLRAARLALWLALRLFVLGEPGRASGWLARLQRLIEGKDCAEAGYALLPVIRRHEMAGEFAEMTRLALRAAEIGDRFHEPDLSAFARTLAGRGTVRQGRIEDGLALLDEGMLSAASGELSPIITGLIYCSMIASCHNIYAFDRAREWTRGLDSWLASQPQLVPFQGACAVHRLEILQLGGAWEEVIEVVRTTTERFAAAEGREADETAGDASYQKAEIHRLRGEHAEADAAYRVAGERGREQQPGLALLRLAQGRGDAAATAIRGVLAATTDPLRRARYLPAAVEISLATGNLEEAQRAAAELEDVAGRFKTDILQAMGSHARAAIDVHEGRPHAGVAPLRSALEVWKEVGAPYIVAKIRLLLGRACRDVGDDDAATIEFDLARKALTSLGATPDLAVIAEAPLAAAPEDKAGLSRRELEVLRHLATGKTNKAIALLLHLSEKTVDRHVSNIFAKIDVSSRAAATAYAYRQHLV